MNEETKKLGAGLLIVIVGLAGVIIYLGVTGSNMSEKYGELLTDYNQLTEDYNILNSPLDNYTYPTIDDVKDWLVDDNTDEAEYIEDLWMCGDFASMLMTRAKLMEWRMRIAVMFYSYEGDDGWQDSTDPFGEYGHIFNVILCQDYDGDGTLDWIYIEPQTVAVWHVYNYYNDFIHYEIWETLDDMDETVWSEPYYINHYSYFE